MDVKDFLPGTFPGTDEQSVVVHVVFLGQITGNGQHPSKYSLVLRGNVLHRGDVFLGNDEQVFFGARVDVVERHAKLVFVFEFGWDLFGDDFAEYALGHGGGITKKALQG